MACCITERSLFQLKHCAAKADHSARTMHEDHGRPTEATAGRKRSAVFERDRADEPVSRAAELVENLYWPEGASARTRVCAGSCPSLRHCSATSSRMISAKRSAPGPA